MRKNKWLVLLGAAFICLCSCDEVLEKSLKDKKVVLLAPVNNLTTTTTTHNLYWEQIDGATSYQVQIVSPRFDSIVTLVADTFVENVKFNIELKKGVYQWRVMASNNSTVSSYSDAWNLTIQ